MANPNFSSQNGFIRFRELTDGYDEDAMPVAVPGKLVRIRDDRILYYSSTPDGAGVEIMCDFNGENPALIEAFGSVHEMDEARTYRHVAEVVENPSNVSNLHPKTGKRAK